MFVRNARKSMKYYCIDCGKEIHWQTAIYGGHRCQSCAQKERLKNPENNPNFVDNRTNKQYFCIDCGDEICWITAINGGGRCPICYGKIHSKKMKGRKFTRKHRENLAKARIGFKYTKEAKRKLSLSHGGTGIPYEFNEYPEEYFKIRPKILKRDNYTCQLCNKYSNEVHHIDYDKENCDEDNLITLCHQCNMKVNTNRNYWYAYFTYIMEEYNAISKHTQ